MEHVLCEPVELNESELDAVAGGWGVHVDVDINIGNHVDQDNNSFNQTSTGNNNNGISGNQVVVS
jgi:hypothetical protein